MKEFGIQQLRNVGLISHGGAGKTTLTEAMLFNSGATDRLGRVDDGSSVIDYDPDEIKRKITLNTTLAPCQWRGNKINVVDTPGYADFVGDVKGSLRVVDGAIVLVCAVSGVEVQTEKVWHYADKYNLPRLVFVNKLERENANFFKALQQIQEQLSGKAVALNIPLGSEDNFKGIIDLVNMQALIYDNEKGKGFTTAEIPAELRGEAEEYREKLIEAIAETDDELVMKYLEGESFTPEEINAGLRAGTLAHDIVPVLCGSALANMGLEPLLDTVVACLPSPGDVDAVVGSDPDTEEEVEVELSKDGPLAALVFKTMADPFVGKLTYFRVYSGVFNSDSQVYNVSKKKMERVGQLFIPRGKEQVAVRHISAGDIGAVARLQETSTGDTIGERDRPILLAPIEFPRPSYSVALFAKSKGDEDKLGTGLGRLMEEDPTLTVAQNTETRELILSGMGDVHLDVTLERLKRKFGVEVDTKEPKIPFRETIRKAVKVEGRHKKQTGGHGQYGHVYIEMEPLAEGEGFVFEESIFGGAVPRQYIPAVEKGIREAMEEGILAGYPVVDFKVNLYDGSYHSVDSSEMAFKIAAIQAFRKAMEEAQPVLLEPIMNLEVLVPDAYMGDVIGDLNSKRGRILGMEPQDGEQLVKAQAPLTELSKYAIDLRSLTQGRGSFEMSFDHYEEVPARTAENIIVQAQKEREGD
ncbi:MAG: elongation factor G [Firmicutes bacterium]|nr:elongation factor G [Bacillota bacterium]